MQLTEQKPPPKQPVDFSTLTDWTYFLNEYKDKLLVKVPEFPNHDNVLNIGSRHYSMYVGTGKVYPVRLVGATYELL